MFNNLRASQSLKLLSRFKEIGIRNAKRFAYSKCQGIGSYKMLNKITMYTYNFTQNYIDYMVVYTIEYVSMDWTAFAILQKNFY